jgi:hypothetical protein
MCYNTTTLATWGSGWVVRIHRHWQPPRPTLPASAQGVPAETLGGAADNGTWCLWHNARDRQSILWMYDSTWAFLLAAGECNLAGGGDRIEEGWQAAGLNGTEWPFPDNANAATPPPPPPSLWACSMLNCTQRRVASTPPP